MGLVVGGVIGAVISAALVVGIQLTVWGNTAPNWYICVCIASGCIFGFSGATLGDKWWWRS